MIDEPNYIRGLPQVRHLSTAEQQSSWRFSLHDSIAFNSFPSFPTFCRESTWESTRDNQEEEQSALSLEEIESIGASTAFTNASNFNMYNPSFVIHHGRIQNTAYYGKKPELSGGNNKGSQRRNFEFNLTIIPIDEINSGKVICVRKGSRFYAATRISGSSIALDVVVQEFEGSTRKQQWEKTLRCVPQSLNPHLLRIVGISPPSISDRDPHYIVYKGACKSNPRGLIASLLAKRDVERLAGVGSQVVYSIASALDYLSNQSPALRLTSIGIENFDVFSDENGRTVVCFTSEPADTTYTEAEMSDVTVCNTFITKLFSDANFIFHRERLDRIDPDIINEAPEVDIHETSGLQSKNGSATQVDFGKKTVQSLDSTSHRQEITWMSRDSNLTLSEMCQSYGDLLDRLHYSEEQGKPTSIPLPRHLGKRWTEVQHDCRGGYRREEITLTPDAFRNKILIFDNPSINERCDLCGEILRLQFSQQSNQAQTNPPAARLKPTSNSPRVKKNEMKKQLLDEKLGIDEDTRAEEQRVHDLEAQLQKMEEEAKENESKYALQGRRLDQLEELLKEGLEEGGSKSEVAMVTPQKRQSPMTAGNTIYLVI
ncbi:hypothetical protein GYMLUDRAFT_263535 [Collybiopsis luxurians FD-317 M1]|uniref:Uncharacterized protein n=1 Tax=Collybiopsis luxurians FD-317 M1 TaxID=944289 RepID=A0A0D0CEW5_9AGAR|nr:hypothetical protein GYMLUDRAFT_263535 [Collybiopsis luxurians FD-317 M1]